jgi:RNA polymerase sigma factor for flagellar operon FliA
MDAVEKFNPELGVKFEYYARTRINGSIYDNLRKLDWAPRSIRTQSKEIDRVISDLEQELGRSVNDVEIAEKMGISMEELEKIFTQGKKALMLSLEDFFMHDSDDMDKASFLKDDEAQSPEDKAEKEAIKKILIDSINNLQYNEKLVVTLYYYNEFTLKEIAATLDLTESRVCQIHSRAIQKLKGSLTRFKKNIL